MLLLNVDYIIFCAKMVEQNVNILIITKVFCRAFLCVMHMVQKRVENFVEVYKVNFSRVKNGSFWLIFMHCAYVTKSYLKFRIGAQIEHFDRNKALSLVTFFARLIIMLQFRNCFFVIPMLYLLQRFSF